MRAIRSPAEGPPEVVAAADARIARDDRHIEVLPRRHQGPKFWASFKGLPLALRERRQQ